MRAIHRDALICDFAEYYRIYDWNTVPIRTAAVLACGLPDDSRTKKEISGNKGGTDTLLLTAILDGINTLGWMNTKDAQSGKNRPESVFSAFTDKETEESEGFDSGEDFLEYRARFVNGEKNG